MLNKRNRTAFIIVLIISLMTAVLVRAGQNDETIRVNRQFDLLVPPGQEVTYRNVLSQAGSLLGRRSFYIAGRWINGDRLLRIAATRESEPVLRTVREELRQPVDLHDFCLFLDDLLLAYQKDEIASVPYIPPGRARSAGILLHPDDVYENKPKRYAARFDTLHIDRPRRQADLKPAEDGDLLGPRWTVRYKNPSTQETMLARLAESAPDKTFVPRIRHLLVQFERQGAYVEVTSTVRSRERGYLMWGSFALGRCKNKNEVERLTAKLVRLNSERKLNIPIRWAHPGGWKETVDAAREMAETYDVVYATERGAFYSNHYDGTAIDMVIRGLPRFVTLTAPDGVRRMFDLSSPEQPRDVSLTPVLVDWIERHYGLKKLRSDYPHWDNGR